MKTDDNKCRVCGTRLYGKNAIDVGYCLDCYGRMMADGDEDDEPKDVFDTGARLPEQKEETIKHETSLLLSRIIDFLNGSSKKPLDDIYMKLVDLRDKIDEQEKEESQDELWREVNRETRTGSLEDIIKRQSSKFTLTRKS